jgi:methyl-accepting chemotaxis protein
MKKIFNLIYLKVFGKWSNFSLKFKLISSLTPLVLIIFALTTMGYKVTERLVEEASQSYKASNLGIFINNSMVNNEILQKEISIIINTKQSELDPDIENAHLYLEALTDSISDIIGEASGLNIDVSKVENAIENVNEEFLPFIEDIDDAKIEDLEKINEQLLSIGDELTTHYDKTSSIINSSYQVTYAVNKNVLPIVVGSILVSLLLMVLAFITTLNISSMLKRAQVSVEEESNKISEKSNILNHAFASIIEATGEQTDSVQETTATLQQVSKMVERNTEAVSNSVSFSKNVEGQINNGKTLIQDSVDSIKELKHLNENLLNVIDESNEKFREIIDLTKTISDKTAVINDIVFQTKLLSFNASVEAARAGEHGKGFSVVAEEVGNLATMSGNSANEISELLESNTTFIEKIISENSKRLTDTVEKNMKSTDKCYNHIVSCDENYSEISKNVISIVEEISSIGTATKEQSDGMSQLNEAITTIDRLSNLNSTKSEEANMIVQEFEGFVGNLSDASQILKSEVFGKKAVLSNSDEEDSEVAFNEVV